MARSLDRVRGEQRVLVDVPSTRPAALNATIRHLGRLGIDLRRSVAPENAVRELGAARIANEHAAAIPGCVLHQRAVPDLRCAHEEHAAPSWGSIGRERTVYQRRRADVVMVKSSTFVGRRVREEPAVRQCRIALMRVGESAAVRREIGTERAVCERAVAAVPVQNPTAE